MKNAEYWIEKLELSPHPEGGFFKEVYRSPELMDTQSLPARYEGENRNFGTSIYFLLKGNQFSTFHRLQSDEIWHFYGGTSAVVYEIIKKTGELVKHAIGSNFESGERFQVVINAGNWFAAEVNDPNSYILVGCTVAPGFDFTDFEMAQKHNLLKAYPKHAELIHRLTK